MFLFWLVKVSTLCRRLAPGPLPKRSLIAAKGLFHLFGKRAQCVRLSGLFPYPTSQITGMGYEEYPLFPVGR